MSARSDRTQPLAWTSSIENAREAAKGTKLCVLVDFNAAPETRPGGSTTASSGSCRPRSSWPSCRSASAAS